MKKTYLQPTMMVTKATTSAMAAAALSPPA